MKRRELQPESVSKPAAEYAQGVEISGARTMYHLLERKTVYVAGQVPCDASGALVGEDDFKAQARQVFANVQAVVEEAGGSMSDIVRLCVYITDISKYAEYCEVRAEFLTEPYPSSTLVKVSGLVKPEWMIEADAIAVIA